ncbi:MAG: hypothetical protein ACI8S6_002664 [Myxococcota bacterium]|jgi:hypothetical protein
MRFLQVASRYQVQLGWLRVIADAIGDGRKSVEEVAEVLLASRDHFNLWWDEAGHAPPARGIAQPATANRAARIGATYGVHDADNQGTLTPLGQVLRHVGPWRGLESPFTWRGPTQWLGLWMIFSVAGDVLLASFRGWPEGGLDAEAAPDFMADVLRRLARSAHGESRKMLRNQASRSTGQLRFARNFLIYPYLEPVRDLGYLEAHGRAGGYRLTAAGARLVPALDDGRSADAWLEEGLHRAFLIADGEPDPQPATAEIFPAVLQSMPPSLMRVPGRASLPIVTLLAQCRLIEARRWLDLRLARSLIDEVIARSGGTVRLEGETLCWEPGATSAAIWSPPPPRPPVRTVVRTTTAAAHSTSPPQPQRPLSLLSQQPAPTHRPQARPLSPPQPQPQPSLVVATAPIAVALSSESMAVGGGEWSLEEVSERVRQWLQHTAEQLQPPSAGRPLRWGGPRSALARLRGVLAAGATIESGDAEALRVALDALAPVEGEALLRRAADRWGGAVADVALRATLERAERATERLTADLRARVSEGLRGEGTWARLSVATDALIADAIALEQRDPAALLGALRRLLRMTTPAAAAERFLDELLVPSRPYTYLQQVSGVLPAQPASGGVTVIEAPGLTPQRQIWVQLSARDAAEALRLGRGRAAHVAAVLSYAAGCPRPEVITEALSPAAPPAAPLIRGLILPPPQRAPLPLAGLIWAAPVSGEDDAERLSAALQGTARADRAADAWPALAQLAMDPLIVLPAAGALAFGGAWLTEALQQAEAALQDAALIAPTPARLALLEQWAGADAVELIQRASASAPALRSLQQPPPPLRPLRDVISLLREQGPELPAQLSAQIRERWPLASERLDQVVAALAEPAHLAAAVERQRAALRALLGALRADAPTLAWQHDEPPARLPYLRGTIDPLLRDAASALRSGVPLDLHWGAVLDRFDDLRSLSGVVGADRLLEILEG